MLDIVLQSTPRRQREPPRQTGSAGSRCPHERAGRGGARDAREIAALAVPAGAAQENYDALVAAGIRAALNFAPERVKAQPGVPLKDVDLRIDLEELAFFLR